MGKIPGMKQVTVYVDPDLLKLIQVLAIQREVAAYVIINEALDEKVARDMSPAELKVFSYKPKKKKKEQNSGHKNGAAKTPITRNSRPPRKAAQAQPRPRK